MKMSRMCMQQVRKQAFSWMGGWKKGWREGGKEAEGKEQDFGAESIAVGWLLVGCSRASPDTERKIGKIMK